MTATLVERPPALELDGGDGGASARRAVVRWAWRLLRREWRQQLMVLALIMVAVGATLVAAAAAVDTQAPADTGFGTAQAMATFAGSDPHLQAEIASLQQRFGPIDVIVNQDLHVSGSVATYQLRAQNPHGPFGQPMLSLLSGHYPSGPHQVAMTPGVAADFGLHLGDAWHEGGTTRQLVGLVQNPQSLLDEFALVAPGQVRAPTQITVLFDTHGVKRSSIGPNVTFPMPPSSGAFSPQTIVLAVATIGMLLIALVAIGGFTVLAQRRLRALGMLGSLGATDRNVRLVVQANGAIVGFVGALLGVVLGFLVWLAYRPHAESSSHHLIGVFQLPWVVIGPAMGLAVLATWFAASLPARAMARMPIVAALSGRPAPPRPIHRSAVPGLVALVVSFLLVTVAGAQHGNGGLPEVVFGLVALVVGVVLLAPMCLSVVGRAARSGPFAGRLALRDLARYRARSGSAMAAISLGVLIAVIVCVLSAARYGNVLDYVGPNLAPNQLIVYPAIGPPGSGGPGIGPSALSASQLAASEHTVGQIASSLGSHQTIELETTTANLNHAAPGRNFDGQLYVATPQLLKAYGITSAQVDPSADILTMRPGLSGTSDMQLLYGAGGNTGYFGPGGPAPGRAPGGPGANSCPKGSCLANPVIQEVSSLPAGTSAPNTVITEHAVHQLGLHPTAAGWLIQTPQALTPSQISGARQVAGAAGMTIETKNSDPTSAEILNWATVFGMVLALGILAMTVGLIRSETASDLRTLAATGASSWTRRWLTSWTAGALALLGALVGLVAGYIASIAYSRDSVDGLGSLGNVPLRYLLLMVIGMPLLAVVGGWLFAGRQPPGMAHQPLE